MSHEERRAFRQGATMGGRSERLRWLSNLPMKERSALRRLYQSLSTDQRLALYLKMKDLSEHEKTTTAKAILSMSTAQLDDYLQPDP